jgi:hypothetical protein
VRTDALEESVDPSAPPPETTALAPERMRVKTRCTWRTNPLPSKSLKTAGGKKRSREEAAGSAAGTSPPVSPPRPNPNQEWKKSKTKSEDLLALLNSGFLREKEVDMWRATAGDPYLMEKNPDEIPMFTRFADRGLSLPASDFFKGLLKYYGIKYLNLNPTVSSTLLSSCISAKPSRGSSPTGYFSGNFSE